jgi:hypothetical protein
LEIDMCHARGRSMMGLTPVLQALGRYHPFTKLGLENDWRLGREEARQLRMALRNIPSLQSLFLASNNLRSAGLAELAPELDCNTSIEVLGVPNNGLRNMESARLLRGIIRHNKTITDLNLSVNSFGNTIAAVESSMRSNE